MTPRWRRQGARPRRSWPVTAAVAAASAAAAAADAAADAHAVARALFQNAQSVLQLAPGPGGLTMVAVADPPGPAAEKNPAANRITAAPPPSNHSSPIVILHSAQCGPHATVQHSSASGPPRGRK